MSDERCYDSDDPGAAGGGGQGSPSYSDDNEADDTEQDEVVGDFEEFYTSADVRAVEQYVRADGTFATDADSWLRRFNVFSEPPPHERARVATPILRSLALFLLRMAVPTSDREHTALRRRQQRLLYELQCSLRHFLRSVRALDGEDDGEDADDDAVRDADQARFDRMCLDAQLAHNNLCSVDIEKDGNCLFRSLASFYDDPSVTHVTMRDCLCRYVERHAQQFAMHVQHACDGMSMDEYVRNMRMPGTWGDMTMLTAYCFWANMNIFVFDGSARPMELYPDDVQQVPPHSGAAHDGTQRRQKLALALFRQHYESTKHVTELSRALRAAHLQRVTVQRSDCGGASSSATAAAAAAAPSHAGGARPTPDCLFDVLAHVLHVHGSVRDAICTHMSNRPDVFQPMLVGTVESYVSRLQQPTMLPEEVVLHAAAHLFHFDVHVYTASTGARRTYAAPPGVSAPRCVSIVQFGDYYEATRPLSAERRRRPRSDDESAGGGDRCVGTCP